MNDVLRPEDYQEPACLLCMDDPAEGRPVSPIDTGRVVDKLEEYLSRSDYDGARRHLEYWLAEARAGNDDRGRLTVTNELMGLHRKCGRRDEALAAADEALALVESLGLAGSVSAGTTLINAATVCKAFGMAERALPLFARARELYEAHLAPDDRRLGGLYNNMGLALADLERYAEARDCYGRAAAVMDRVPDGQLDKAVTLLNLADLEESERGPLEAEEAVSALLAEAEALIDTPSLPRDGYYAFVCEKCAPVFGHYGWFLAEKKYRDASRGIYERT